MLPAVLSPLEWTPGQLHACGTRPAREQALPSRTTFRPLRLGQNWMQAAYALAPGKSTLLEGAL